MAVFRSFVALFAFGASVSLARAQDAPDLANASLEDLMKVTITSASRREQSVIDVAAAVYVINQEDIRRSGLTLVPELLRLAPGVNVARIDGNKWAIAVRGFNYRWSNKLLVLVDGRTVYNRLISGVYWDTIDLPIELIDRIEVIRGPGGSIWGANAVDGVINILTKPATATRGGFVRAGVTSDGAEDGAAQYSGSLGRAAYRVHAQWFDRGDLLLPGTRADGGDDSRSGTGGFRVDWSRGRNELTVHGDVSSGTNGSFVANIDGPVPPPGGWRPNAVHANWSTGHVLAKWTRATSDHSSMELQAFVDRIDRDDPVQKYHATTGDIDFTYRTTIGRHSVIGGAGSRVTHDHVDGNFTFSVTPDEAALTIFSLFAQDEIGLAANRFRLTLGSKVERDTLGGWGVQPTVRALWRIDERQRVWAAFSRALRPPARVDRGMTVRTFSFIGDQGLPVVLGLRGNPEYRTEELLGFDVGYRADVGPSLSLDANAYFNEHERLQSFESQAPELVFQNGRPYLFIAEQFHNDLHAVTRGIELAASWRPIPWWHLHSALSTFHLTSRFDSLTGNPTGHLADGNAPAYQWHLRSSVTLRSRLELDGQVFAVGALRGREVPSYWRSDAQATWKLTPSLSLSAAGQNLFGSGHLEFGGVDNAATPSVSSRTTRAQLLWRF